MLDKLCDFFRGKRVLLLGFGLEGQSSLRLLEKMGCAAKVTVWETYKHTTPLPDSSEVDVVIKSPGIPLFGNTDPRITGQADLFLQFCDNKTIGVTGTKGKSTTASLIHHILVNNGKKSCLIGNIGVPPLDVAGELEADEYIVAELSCHQLEYCTASPRVAVFLNLYEEHLDHYTDFAHYRAAKENIFKYQRSGDVLIRGEDVDSSAIEAAKATLRGVHNLHNIAIAVKAAKVCADITQEEALAAAYSFAGLEHRLELFAEINGVKWVNDSISTIPAAVIAAVTAFPETDTLIIGGMDRGIDYSDLVTFLHSRPDINVVALPDSGHTIADKLDRANVYKAADMTQAVARAKAVTRRCCVLSPAAASYGFYRNFEERGQHYKELVRK
ncbi:MAG: UDP-N-acetylmuramoyl-L-alanine--D-glutamate ligase [Oscillospiraceae bacterium]|nr:UDP-N-acetylmuramoyl-L-alanine--D-glutamate ligase [Oscillospiraceae bacterium]